jgi:amidohydrolase
VDPIEPPLVNDPQLAMRTAEWLTRSGFAVGEIFRSCGSDDFAHYSTVAPSIMVFLGVGGEGVPMLHEPRFLPDDGRVYDVARAALAGYRAAVAYDAES